MPDSYSLYSPTGTLERIYPGAAGADGVLHLQATGYTEDGWTPQAFKDAATYFQGKGYVLKDAAGNTVKGPWTYDGTVEHKSGKPPDPSPDTPAAVAGHTNTAQPTPFIDNKTDGYLYTSDEGPATGATPVRPASDQPKPNAELQALIDKANDPTPWYERAWNTTKKLGTVLGNQAEAAQNDPGEAGIGLLKGLGNMITSDLWNLAVMAAKAQNHTGLMVAIMNSQALQMANAGDIAGANAMAAAAREKEEFGYVGDLFELKNDAQKFGSLSSILVPVGTIAKTVTSAAKLGRGVHAAEDLSKIAGETARLEETAKTVDAANDTSKLGDAAKADEAANAGKGAVVARTAAEGGAFGEKRMHEFMKERGYERIDKGGEYKHGHTGIDGVYRNTNPPHDYVVADAKYNTAQLEKLADGTKQMSDPWIRDRLTDALGRDAANAVRKEMENGTLNRLLVRVDPEGKIVARFLNSDANIIRGIPHF